MPHHRHTIPVATSALFFVCLMLHAQTSLSAQAFASYNDAEAYKVYESLLPADWSVRVAHARRLLIQAQTGSTDFCLEPAPESTALLRPLFDSFVALTKTTWLLQPKFSHGIPYQFISGKDLDSFFEPGGGDWEALAKRYPDSAHSYIVLSPVAFNADKVIAVVYMDHSCGLNCDRGTFHVLEKKDGVWKNIRWMGTSRAWAS